MTTVALGPAVSARWTKSVETVVSVLVLTGVSPIVTVSVIGLSRGCLIRGIHRARDVWSILMSTSSPSHPGATGSLCVTEDCCKVVCVVVPSLTAGSANTLTT